MKVKTVLIAFLAAAEKLSNIFLPFEYDVSEFLVRFLAPLDVFQFEILEGSSQTFRIDVSAQSTDENLYEIFRLEDMLK